MPSLFSGANLRGEKKEEEKGKKVLTRGEGFGILTKLSARETAPGKRERKKPLDSRKEMW